MRRLTAFVPVLVAALTAVVTLGAAPLPAAAQSQESGDTSDSSPHSEVDLVTEATVIAPGEPFTVGLRIDMEEGWHSYWKNPGDSGAPVSVQWNLPDGFEAGPMQWPYPHRIDASMLTSYGYSGVVTFPIRITPPQTLEPGTEVTLTGTAEWLICADICLPAEGDVQRTLRVGETAAQGPEASVIADAQADVPKTIDAWNVRAARSEGSYTLALSSPTARPASMDGAQFFPEEKKILDHSAPQPFSVQNGTALLALQQSPYAQEPADSLTGVLVAPEGKTWDAAGRVRAMQVNVPVDSVLTGLGSSTAGGSSGLSLPWAILFAFAGGMLLNLMPCVFPILSVKILGFTDQAGGDGATMRRHGLLFGAGVLVSMWVVAGILLGLRAAGSEVGWGFQLQSPTFVALMALLFVGIGLNLLGTFEIGTTLMNWGGRVQSAGPTAGKTGAFLTGVLATVVATPCTAPFMGAALGVALTLSATGAIAIFTALGAGMATPYVGLSFAPALLDRLPKPGAWMETLKQLFAFPMFATAIWLVWVFGQQAGNGGVAALLFAMLLLGMAAWVVNRWSAPQLSRAATLVSRTAVAVMIAGAIAVAVAGARSPQPGGPADGATGRSADAASATWQSYSPERVEQLRESGRPVFVDFTAAWCLTCQVNERTVLSTDRVQEAFEERDVALVKADWTNRDSTITAALRSHGRSGVPVYVLYSGTGSEPTLLPEVLTERIVLDALRQLPDAE